MRQEYFVGLELDGVAEDSGDEIDAVEGVVLQRVPRVWRDGLVVPVDLVKRRVRVVGYVGSRAHDHLKISFGKIRIEVWIFYRLSLIDWAYWQPFII